ncbi:ABC transporter ATP-binding protein [Labrys wisconsinensis]|uniref:Spermidine/putrescine transport system ATP-binding protein n=1 Tax=Labrys wisconsinensis TaxID=425677 RepID=A0ABU0J9A3_9HYPH|nr:ABC transporter ATP-binding protein [Labrys wisconsinensis]MDQ0470853.1 spermidine/putrescine transport system ATP-binding protein [Labrys wisconsinensis]
MSHFVELHQVGMAFGATRAVGDVTFTVEGGEFFSILGPSGCGKTTILRMIAGFLHPTEGRILIGGRDMTGLGPNERPTAMIFQSLALFPLMPVWENIAFGLEARGVSRAERRRKADELLGLIALEGYGGRMPGELSGGQRQRVAIARALAVEPQVLLLDEPLSALDLKLRQHMRAELRALQKRTGVTFIYITHDQSEALAMSDRIAVMSAGALEQVGTPRELYANPATPFVAGFVGEINAVAGTVTAVERGMAALETRMGVMRGRAGPALAAGQRAKLYVRPEVLVPGDGGENRLTATVERIDFEGAFALAHGRLDDGADLVASLLGADPGAGLEIGMRASFGFAAERAVVLADG